MGPVGPFVHPGRFTVRLIVDGMVVEKPLDVRLDPRVKIDPADLRLQTDLSHACYRGANEAADVRAAIDRALAGSGGDPARRAALRALRGEGLPGDPDILYESITAVPAKEETTVGLQETFLYMLNLLQAADARPTRQARSAVEELQKTLGALKARLTPLVGTDPGTPRP